jgi:hypothetical protein
VTVRPLHPPRSPLLAALAAGLAGLLLGACGGTLYDAAGVPPLTSGPVCSAPQHVCGGACVAQSIAACGTGCDVCSATDPNADAVCQQAPGGAWGCGQTCQPGWFACSSGCCRATAVAAGDAHACAVTSDGGLVCWGKNDAGQLGPGAAGLPSSIRPVGVFTSGVTAVAGGGRHTCAVVAGVLKCWGANEAGQLGNGSTTGSSAPVAVSGAPAAVSALALGASHSCAIGGGGAVSCWGANGSGQLGTGDLVTPRLAPVASLVSSGATRLSAAGDDSCAVVGTGAAAVAKCWGLDVNGQTGGGLPLPSPASRPTPVTVPLAGPALGVVAGRKHACATIDNGAGGTPLFCWGAAAEGEMGNGITSPPIQDQPKEATDIDGNGRAAVILAGEAFTCSAKAGDATMKCAGKNDQLQAGGTPPEVAFGGVAAAASAGRAFSCALVDVTGALVVKCWGSNTDGQLGRVTAPATSSATPLPVEN